MTPRVSVIVPAYRCEKTVESSIRSALMQTVGEIEVIAVDDGSPDGTPDVLRALAAEDSRVRVITLSENGGVANARNCAVQAARAEYLAFLDSDDLWKPEKLERQLSVAEQAFAALVCTAALCIDGDGKPTGKRFSVPASLTADRLLYGNDIVTSTVLVRREVYERHPMEQSHLHEDVISWYRILKSGAKAVGIDEPLALYRVTKDSKTGSKFRSAAMMWNTYRFLGVKGIRRIFCFAGYVLHGVGRYWL